MNTEYHPWFVVRATIDGEPWTSQGYDSLEDAEIRAADVAINPDASDVQVLRSRRVHTTRGVVIGRTAVRSIYDHTVYEQHGQAMAVYASVKGDHHEPADLSAVANIVVPRTDAQKSAWAKANPQCFPFHVTTVGVNL